jgi:hypothetical protein
MPQYCYPDQQNATLLLPRQTEYNDIANQTNNATLVLPRPTEYHTAATQANRMPHYCYTDQQNATLLLPRLTECHTIATQTNRMPHYCYPDHHRAFSSRVSVLGPGIPHWTFSKSKLFLMQGTSWRTTTHLMTTSRVFICPMSKSYGRDTIVYVFEHYFQ